MRRHRRRNPIDIDAFGREASRQAQRAGYRGALLYRSTSGAYRYDTTGVDPDTGEVGGGSFRSKRDLDDYARRYGYLLVDDPRGPVPPTSRSRRNPSGRKPLPPRVAEKLASLQYIEKDAQEALANAVAMLGAGYATQDAVDKYTAQVVKARRDRQRLEDAIERGRDSWAATYTYHRQRPTFGMTDKQALAYRTKEARKIRKESGKTVAKMLSRRGPRRNPAMRATWSPVNSAWILLYGDSLIDLDGQRSWPEKKDLKWALRIKGLRLKKDNRVEVVR